MKQISVVSLDDVQAYCAENGLICVPKEAHISQVSILNTIEYICECVPEYAVEIQKAFVKYSREIWTAMRENMKHKTPTYGNLIKDNVAGKLDDFVRKGSIYLFLDREKTPPSYARKIAKKIKQAHELRKTLLGEDASVPCLGKILSPEDINNIISAIYDTSGVGVFTEKNATASEELQAIIDSASNIHGFIVCEHVERRENQITETAYGFVNIDFYELAFGAEFPGNHVRELYSAPTDKAKRHGELAIDEFFHAYDEKNGRGAALDRLKKVDGDVVGHFVYDEKVNRIGLQRVKPNPTGYISDIFNVIGNEGRGGEIRIMDYIEYDIGLLEHSGFYKDDVPEVNDHSPLIDKIAFFAAKNRELGKISQDDINECMKQTKVFIRTLTAHIPDTATYDKGTFVNEKNGTVTVRESVANVFCMRLLGTLFNKIDSPDIHPDFVRTAFHASSRYATLRDITADMAPFFLGENNVAPPIAHPPIDLTLNGQMSLFSGDSDVKIYRSPPPRSM